MPDASGGPGAPGGPTAREPALPADLQEQLRSARTQVQGLTAERDALQVQLTSLRGERDSLRQQNAQLTASTQKERDALQAEITQLKAQAAAPRIGKPIPASDLAARFGSVIEKLAETKPAAGQQVAAALTGLEVEARGLLQVPEGQNEIHFTTVDGGDIKPESLSTIKMTFRPVPVVPPVEP